LFLFLSSLDRLEGVVVVVVVVAVDVVSVVTFIGGIHPLVAPLSEVLIENYLFFMPSYPQDLCQ